TPPSPPSSTPSRAPPPENAGKPAGPSSRGWPRPSPSTSSPLRPCNSPPSANRRGSSPRSSTVSAPSKHSWCGANEQDDRIRHDHGRDDETSDSGRHGRPEQAHRPPRQSVLS